MLIKKSKEWKDSDKSDNSDSDSNDSDDDSDDKAKSRKKMLKKAGKWMKMREPRLLYFINNNQFLFISITSFKNYLIVKIKKSKIILQNE